MLVGFLQKIHTNLVQLSQELYTDCVQEEGRERDVTMCCAQFLSLVSTNLFFKFLMVSYSMILSEFQI